jgi:transposase-like protein
MPQLHLPLFPAGATEITQTLSFARIGETVTYFHCGMPLFSHDRSDRASFRMIAAQMYVTSGVKQADLARAFGVPQITIKRAVKLYKAEGAKGFFAPRATRGASVLLAPVLQQAQEHLDGGMSAPMVAAELGIKPNTLSKAIRAGRLHVPAKKKAPTTPRL